VLTPENNTPQPINLILAVSAFGRSLFVGERMVA